jgi:hypothetical protein
MRPLPSPIDLKKMAPNEEQRSSKEEIAPNESHSQTSCWEDLMQDLVNDLESNMEVS